MFFPLTRALHAGATGATIGRFRLPAERSVSRFDGAGRWPFAWLITPAFLLLMPVCFFLAFFHAATLQVGNPGWLINDSDNGENALGAHAFWHDGSTGTSLKTTLLNSPEGVPVLYTDSNPLISLAARPFATLMPVDAQLVGPSILFSLILQAVFAWLLLRRHAPGPIALWAGVALLAFPPTLANRFIHANLMAHWTILAALWLFLDNKRGDRLVWWMPLIAATALIHSYLLVMVGAIWASAMLMRFVESSGWKRLVTVGQGAAVLAMVAILAAWLGVGDQMWTGTFGTYAMPLDALWNPGNPNFSRLLPSPGGNPGRWSEGFQYLGAGGLVLLATAVVVARSRPVRDGERLAGGRLRGLAPALVVLGFLATIQFPLPTLAMKLLDPVRASGRLFWPVGYVLVFMAILAVFRLSAERAGLALIGMVALQIVDLGGMATMIRAQSRAADLHQLYHRSLDPRWDNLVGQAQSIAFMPGNVTRNLGLYQEIAWRAVKLGRPVTNVYAARTSRATLHRLNAEAAAFARGALVPSRLYVMLSGGVPVPAAAASRVLRLDGITVIAPAQSR